MIAINVDGPSRQDINLGQIRISTYKDDSYDFLIYLLFVEVYTLYPLL